MEGRSEHETQRVAITGLGACTPIGTGVERFWRNALQGCNGLKSIASFDHSELRTHLGGEIQDFVPEQYLGATVARAMGRAAQLAAVAGRMALEHAGFEEGRVEGYAPERRAVSFGTTMGEPGLLDRLVRALVAGEAGDVLDLLFELPSFRISNRLGELFDFRGPNVQLPTACTAGNYAIGHAADLLRTRRADIVLAGGSDALSRLAHVGFNKLLAVTPDRVRPFDRDRNGMAVAEGAGALVLERFDDARRRGATVLAEFLDWGMGCDAHKMTIPHPEGRGGKLALSRALARSGLGPADVDYVSAHGTGTRENDKIETDIIKHVFGEQAYRLKVSSIKSMLGHTMGAASALEAVACVLALRAGQAPPTINYETPDPDCDLDIVPNVPVEAELRAAASNAYAFGGNCSTIVLRRFIEGGEEPARSFETGQRVRVVVSAAGAFSALGLGLAATRAGLRAGRSAIRPVPAWADEHDLADLPAACLPAIDPKTVLGGKGLRDKDRMTTTLLCCIEADLGAPLALLPERDDIGLVLGTSFSSLASQIGYTWAYEQGGSRALNTTTFPNMVLNTAASQANIWFGLTGSCATLTSGFTAGLDAVAFAADQVRAGRARQMIAGGVDELVPVCARAYARRGQLTRGAMRPLDGHHDGLALGEGAAVVLVERAEDARRRGAPVFGELLGYASSFAGRPRAGFCADGAIRAMRGALDAAAIDPEDVDFVAVSANGHPPSDELEREALEQVFGGALPELPLVAYKSYFGDCLSASGALQLVAALVDLEDGIVSATCGFEQGHPQMRALTTPLGGTRPAVALINAFGCTGSFTSLVVRRLSP